MSFSIERFSYINLSDNLESRCKKYLLQLLRNFDVSSLNPSKRKISSLQNITKRKRPFERYNNIKRFVIPPDKYSLPSGHASASIITTLILINFFPELNIIIIWPVLVSISRIVLGVHYIGDTIIGLFLGYLCFYIAKIIWSIY